MSFPNRIYLDAGSAPFIAADTIQKYTIGQMMEVEDLGTFAYTKTGGDILRTDLGVKNGLPQGIAQRAIVADVPIGGKSVILTTAATDGAAGTGLIAKDAFKGGKIVFFTVGAVAPYNSQIRRITGNTARVATGNLPVTFTFEPGLTIALVAGSSVAEAIQSPYSYGVQDTDIGHVVVGVPTVLSTSGQFQWLQTWGITWLSCQAPVGIAGAVGLRFRHDGSLDLASTAVGAYVSGQLAGYTLAESSTNTQGAPFFMLQLVP